MHALDLLKQNWAMLATALGVWAALATFLNRVPSLTPDKNTPKWKLFLHSFLIDWPAMLPKVNFTGIFGLPVNVPFFSLSKADPSAPSDKSLLMILGLSGALMLSACAGVSAGTATSATLAGLTDVIQCTPAAYGAFSDAARNGGAGWAAAILETLQCAGKVYQDVSSVIKAQPVAFEGDVIVRGKLLAGDGATEGDQVWTKEALKRLARCYRMYRALYGSKVL